MPGAVSTKATPCCSRWPPPSTPTQPATLSFSLPHFLPALPVPTRPHCNPFGPPTIRGQVPACVKVAPPTAAFAVSSDPVGGTSHLPAAPHTSRCTLSFDPRANTESEGSTPTYCRAPGTLGTFHQTDNPATKHVPGTVLEGRGCRTTLPPKCVSWAPDGPCLAHLPFP